MTLKSLLSSDRAKNVGIAILALAGTIVYLRVGHAVYPIGQWLFWRLAAIWGWLLLLHLACLGVGARLLTRPLGLADRPVAQTFVLSAAVGILTWVLVFYVLGAVGGYRTWVALAMPAVFLAVGWPGLRVLLERWRARPKSDGAPARVLDVAMVAFGTLGLGLIYLQLLSPDTVNYDASWCHMTIAQDYAREGRIVDFPADYAKNVPQLTPILNVWGFLLPGLNQPLRWMMALHNEFILFLWTLVGIVAAVGWILDDERRARHAWAGFFLFPGIYVYDCNLGGAADHVLAFWVIPLLLATATFMRKPSVRHGVLLGALGAATLLTKYQAMYLLPPAAAFAVAGWWADLRARRGAGTAPSLGRALVPLAAAALAFLVVESPALIRNTIFHHNPMYPFAQQVFTGSKPRFVDGAYLFNHIFTDVNWVPKGTTGEKALSLARNFVAFSFEPHYFWSLHHGVPTYGALFTLLLPMLIFLGRQPRLWLTVASASFAVLLWAATFLVDRNLQTFTPLVVAATGGMLALVWRRGALARGALALLVATQLVWGGDAMFAGEDRMRAAFQLIRSGFNGTAKERWAGYRAEFIALGNALPADATVLLHTEHYHLGINRRVDLDWTGFQGLFDYRGYDSLRKFHDALRAAGVTHIVREAGGRFRPAPTKAEEVIFGAYVGAYAKLLGTFGAFELYELPTTPPPDRRLRVLGWGIGGYHSGVFPVTRLDAVETMLDVRPTYSEPEIPVPPEPGTPPYESFLRDVDAILIAPGSSPPPEVSAELARFRLLPTTSQAATLYYAAR